MRNTEHWLSVVLGLGAVALAVAITLRSMPEHLPGAKATTASDGGPLAATLSTRGDGGSDPLANGSLKGAALSDSLDAPGLGAPGLGGQGLGDGGDPVIDLIGDGLGSDSVEPDTAASADGGPRGLMPDGTPVPPLPSGAPRQVRFGVVLVTFAGAQGAGANARSKTEAAELAHTLATEAKTDFRKAVARGDSGSGDDLGRIPRGVLEPAVEYALFALPAGGVSEVIETPRGFWITKRIE